MSNVTLKIDDGLLKKARRLAAEKNTSFNAIVREKIEEFVLYDSKKETVIKGLESFYNRCKTNVGAKKWTRDELHER